MKETREFAQGPKGSVLTLECGHTVDWPRPVSTRGRVFCFACDDNKQITKVAKRGK